MKSNITLCITIGLRPDLLEKTLLSLLSQWQPAKIIAINDFHDEPTNQKFKSIVPDGTLISLGRKLGHHAAVDFMYDHVETPYIFHCEDDWLFDKPIDINAAFTILQNNSNISQVCFRKITDFNYTDNDFQLIQSNNFENINYFTKDHLHSQWHGYTFNPHLAPIDLWRSVGGFSNFKKERHISRTLRSRGLLTAYIEPGACHHIGELESVSSGPNNQNAVKFFKNKLKNIFKL